MIDLFGKRKIQELENKINELECKLFPTEYQLSQWRSLYDSLKKFDWFEIGAGGAIIAHGENEPISEHCSYGTIFTVPMLFSKLRW